MAGDIPIPGDPGLAPLHLFSDAACLSRSPTKVSAFAALLVAGLDSHFHAGLLQRGVTESQDAELLAVAFALEYFISRGHVDPLAQVIVHTDSQAAMHYLNGRVRPKAHMHRVIAALEHIGRLVADNGLRLSSSWVKGHQGFDAKCWRGLINARVDREARRLAKEHQRELQKAEAA